MSKSKYIKWIGLILMIAGGLTYWLSKFNDLGPLWTNASLISIALGAVIMATGVILDKQVNKSK
ncbi:hypothetical protein [Halobacillus naozhouensis]|uniref:Uncharacterized protein n=1 Tax=Halobacillus naozhouensis TaxID=554880 RepID=A0ABY8J357_9BACI|nr:hypothetical protein [Halobacillus naozhouensis]WFT76507.1 hypothetical protein P9989_09145 [Halobacillus naozhouensis]